MQTPPTLAAAYVIAAVAATSDGRSQKTPPGSAPARVAATRQALDLPAGQPDSFAVVVAHRGTRHTLRLWRRSVRAADFAVQVTGPRGELVDAPTPPVTTYRGGVDGRVDVAVAASLRASRLHAAVIAGDGTAWFVEPTGDAHESYELGRGALPPGWCGCDALHHPPAAAGRGSAPSQAGFKIAEVAFDADFEYFQRLGRSVPATVAHLEAAMAATNLIYERDVQIGHRISRIIVRTTEPDPYTEFEPGKLLRQFRDHWFTRQTAVRRDVAHFMTGRDMNGNIIGLAWVSVVCNRSWGYALSQWRNSFGSRVTVLGHELGHNWSAPHCLDPRCVLMCGGCHSFGPKTRAKIIAYRDSRPCLDALQLPKLTGIAPSIVSHGRPGAVELTGTDLDFVQSVEVGARRTQAFSRVSATKLSFTPPFPLDFGKYPVKVANAVGVSGPVEMTVAGDHPSVIGVPSDAIRRFPFSVGVYTDRGWQALVLVSTDKVPSSVPGLISLGIGNGFRSVFPVALLRANPRGLASFATILPVTLATGAYHWQAVTFDPAKLAAPLEVSNVATGRIH